MIKAGRWMSIGTFILNHPASLGGGGGAATEPGLYFRPGFPFFFGVFIIVLMFVGYICSLTWMGGEIEIFGLKKARKSLDFYQSG